MKNPFQFNQKRITTIVFDEIDSMCNRFQFDNVKLIYRDFLEDSRTQVNNYNFLYLNYETIIIF